MAAPAKKKSKGPKLPVPSYAPPATRRLRVYSVDPALALKVEALDVAKTSLDVRWHDYRAPGPMGEYLDVIDVDPASRCFYPPVDLDRPELLAQEGLEPSEGDPRFHQQMVYAVAMVTIASFERALGRRVHWAPRRKADGIYEYVPKLRLYPHALRGRNAYYDPVRKAILFGYFPADSAATGGAISGGLVFTALSFDIIAHETTHAILDGLQRRFIEPTNPDVLAFHEAFADIVALFQHFALSDLLEYQILKTQGDLETENLLAKLATQFGEGMGKHGALRDFIGKVVEVDGKKVWKRQEPDPALLSSAEEPHDRGSILVSAVFGAFLEIYKTRTADLLRLATGGTGILQPGAIDQDLMKRLANEAAKAAKHVLDMCIRALDYCAPIDITFGDYLRAILTADFELVPNDKYGYRIAFVQSFRRWGIFPRESRTLGEQSLIWQSLGGQIDLGHFENQHRDWVAAFRECVKRHVREYSASFSREQVQAWSGKISAELHALFRSFAEKEESDARAVFGIERERLEAKSVGMTSVNEYRLEVHNARPSFRIPVDGNAPPGIDLVIQLTQKAMVRPTDLEDAATSAEVESSFLFRGGSTIVYDVERETFKYVIRRDVQSKTRRQRQRDYIEGRTSVADLYFNRFGDQFKMLHAGDWSI